jgi:capsular exopolysaccharide synthesis family protein
MSAALLQSELKAAFDGSSAREGRPGPPASRVAVGDILARLGRIDAAGVERIVALQKERGRSFEWAAGKLRLVPPHVVNTAAAIGEGHVRADASAFLLAKDLVVIRRPASLEAEQFRNLRTRLVTAVGADRLNLFAVTPIGSGARGAYVAANLATALAQLKRRVLLVDANLRRQGLQRSFGVSPRAGLAEILSGAAALDATIVDTPVNGLALIAGGAGAVAAQELLAGEAFGAALTAARKSFDIVMVLTAGFGPVADAQFVFAQTKVALITARRHETRLNSLAELQAALRQTGAETLGAVLTD